MENIVVRNTEFTVNHMITDIYANVYIYNYKTKTINKLSNPDEYDYNAMYYHFKDLAIRQLVKITADLEDKYCLFFGTNVWYSSKNLEDVLIKKLEYDEKHLYTSLYYPSEIIC